MPNTPTPQDPNYDRFIPYATYAKVIALTQDKVNTEFAVSTWMPVLLLQPSTNTTLVAAQVHRADTPWKKLVRVQLQDATLAAELLDTVMGSTTSAEKRMVARTKWNKLCTEAAEADPDVEQMRNPDYKLPSEQSRIILA